VAIAEEYHALDRLSQKSLMRYGMNMLRDTLLKVSGSTSMVRSKGGELDFIERFSKVMDVEKIEKSYTLMNDASYHLERNGSAKMIFLDLSLKLSSTIKP
jgi:DNA polymerase-3 subunit delta'